LTEKEVSMNKKKKIGIIGGTFNPVHIGHLILAENAYDSLKLTKVVFMPTGHSYLKDPSTILEADLRLKLINASISGNDHFESSDYEIRKPGNTYTSETLSELNELHPDSLLYFIIGEDSIYNIESWHEPEVIFKNCVLVVAPRGHEPDEKLLAIKKHLEEGYGAHIELLDTPDIDISSTMIRERINTGRSIKYYVPDCVADIIFSEGLYK
jgi:nicotinate-nucleotide adenylyltransferase